MGEAIKQMPLDKLGAIGIWGLTILIVVLVFSYKVITEILKIYKEAKGK